MEETVAYLSSPMMDRGLNCEGEQAERRGMKLESNWFFRIRLRRR